MSEMHVKIVNYKCFPGQDRVDTELSVALPTGSVSVTVPVVESALYEAAGGGVWDETHLVKIVSGFFKGLAETVSVAS